MDYSNLSLQQTPPLTVPLRFFLTAPLFGVAAGLMLLVHGPEVLMNRWMPLTLGVTHLLTLGFASMVMLGALQQMLPVVAGSPLSHPEPVSRWVHRLFSLGVVVLVAGLSWLQSAWMLVAMVLLGLALSIFLLSAGRSLLRVPRMHDTARGMALAVTALLVTALLGLHMAATYVDHSTAGTRWLTDIHAGWGFIGWMLLLVLAVGLQVVPLFQVTPEYPRILARHLPPLVFILLAAWALTAAASLPSWVTQLSAAPLAAGVAWFAVTTLYLQHRRKRRLPDVTVWFWRTGMGSLLLATGLWGVAQALPQWAQAPAYPLVLGILMIVGFVLAVVNGMLYKIVPFLVWLHLNNRQLAAMMEGHEVHIPHMRQILPERPARWQFFLFVAALLLALAAAWQPLWLARPAGAAFALSSGLLWWNVYQAARLFRRVMADIDAVMAGKE
jgi:hypothetical protein